MELGKIGVWTTHRAIGEGQAPAAARLVEDLGYGTFWLGGSPRLPSLRPLLEATERIVVGTSIVNIWAYHPRELAAEYAALSEDFRDRLLVGIGVGHPEAASDYTRPLTAMRAFLDGLDAAAPPLGRGRRALAALRPKMLALSAERSLGALPYFVPVSHTSFARAQLGPGPLLAPEVAVVVDDDDERARVKARAYAKTYLGLSNYTNNLLALGFSEDDIAGDGSDRLIDAVVPHGTGEDLAKVVDAHIAAGADHVALQPVGEPGIPRHGWTALAEAVLR
ncbi:MAG TPA: TIGR03620 family F420-dependent LLM class oxidoreductase [Gaiellales bacterium]|jgi:probable F420-dependent oxidoreductase|nr:TIGR03620 family F420-dependent LLM class oxidoreductase [Gaiellales bacterium]